VQDKNRFPDGALLMTWGKRQGNTDEDKKAWFRTKVQKLAEKMDAITVTDSWMQRIWNALTGSQQSLRQALEVFENSEMVRRHDSISSLVLSLVDFCLTSGYQDKQETHSCVVLQSCVGVAEKYQLHGFSDSAYLVLALADPS
jgi:hypothetical protein